MASKNRGQTPDIKERLFKESSRFSFVQAFRLLHFILSKQTGLIPDDQDIQKKIRVRPELSLDFPENDITAIENISEDPVSFLITATFIGLYGSSSPLPTFYTEDLLREQLDEISITRDFIDILNSPLYHIFFKCWGKYRLFYKIVEQPDPETSQRLYCLLGMEGDQLQKQVENSHSLLRYIGLATQFPRSAEGLRSILSDSFHEPSIRIIQCVSRIAEIPKDQRCILGTNGNTLGETSHLGMEIVDRMGKFMIQAGPFNSDTFHNFLPDRPAFRKMSTLVRFYLDQPLIWDVELFINSDKIDTARLGGNRWSQLGWNSWIFSEKFHSGTVSVKLNVPEKC